MQHQNQKAPEHPLRTLLKERGLKQNEFAVLAGTTGVIVSQYIAGYTGPTPAKIQRAVEALWGIPGAELEAANERWKAEFKLYLLQRAQGE